MTVLFWGISEAAYFAGIKIPSFLLEVLVSDLVQALK